MADEIKELVPTVVPRRADGRFLPGKPPGPGRTKGSLDRITKLMREQFVEFAQTHSTNANPLIGLAKIAMDEENEPSAIRVRAWEVLLRHISPMLMKIEAEAPDENVDQQITAVVSVLRSLVKKDA